MSDKISSNAIGNAIIVSTKIADNAIDGSKIADDSISIVNISAGVVAVSSGIKISSVVYLSGLPVAGTSGEFCNLTGSGFANGALVFVANYQCLTYYVSTTSLQFRVPTALTPGSYWIYVKNPNGTVGIKPNAIAISTTPSWVSPAGLIGRSVTQNFSSYQFSAASDSAVSYTLESGTLPTGMSLTTSGNLSGSPPYNATEGSPYYFTVRATDVELQNASRSFILIVDGSVNIASINYPNNQTAANIGGGETINLRGNNFASGAVVIVGNQASRPTVVANSTSLTFTSSSEVSGYYPIKVINSNGSFGNIMTPIFRYSPTPTWTGSSVLPNIESNIAYYANVFTLASSSSDSEIRYFTASDINLPTGITFNANTGIISGLTSANSNVTYTFNLNSFDAENQSTPLRFTANIQKIPEISTISVQYVSIDGGQASVYGNNFSNTATVYFDGSATSTTFVSSNQLNYITPPREFGNYGLYVTQGNLQFSNAVLATATEPAYGNLTIANASGYLSQATLNNYFSANIFASNANAIVSWTQPYGTLPPGLTLSSTGNVARITGTVTDTVNINIYKFAIRATDALGQKVTKFYKLWVSDQVNQPLLVTNYVMVAGGGGGGYGVYEGGGGGGAGGLLQNSKTYSLGTVDAAVIGAGGIRSSGSNTTFAGNTAIGGGLGGDGGLTSGTGVSGGSGGGGSGYNFGRSGGSGTLGQGYAGGFGPHASPDRGGGGGGAGGPGIDGSSTGNGGPSLFVANLGISLAGGGGGSGSHYGTAPGLGGGAGATSGAQTNPIIHALNATVNTGSGGGGGTSYLDRTANPGTGGSGVVFVRYIASNIVGTGGTVSFSNGAVIHTITSSTTFDPFGSFLSPNQTPIWLGNVNVNPTDITYAANLNCFALSANVYFELEGNYPFTFYIDQNTKQIKSDNAFASGIGIYNFTIRATDTVGRTSTISATANITSSIKTIEYAVIAAGGGGGSGVSSPTQPYGGGGGGGEVIEGNALVTTSATYTIIVGGGGSGASTNNGTTYNAGSNGGNSMIISSTVLFANVLAQGGGAGGSQLLAVRGFDGGSGGGAAGSSFVGTQAGASGLTGGSGGTGVFQAGGGGGGAGGAGGAGIYFDAKYTGGTGGAGKTITSLGPDPADLKLNSPWQYGGGGGAGGADLGAAGGGFASFGGGYGGRRLSPSQNDGGVGAASSGGGGGGGLNGGTGGSGRVMVRYPTGIYTGTGGSITQGSGYTYHTFDTSSVLNLTYNLSEPQPIITYPYSYTSLATSGFQTLTITRNPNSFSSQWNSNIGVFLNNVAITSNLVNSSTITILTPALTTGNYDLVLSSIDGRYTTPPVTVVYSDIEYSYLASGNVEYTTSGTYSWTAPANVRWVHAVAVGGGGAGNYGWSGHGGVFGGAGGGGGGLGWKNYIPVTPGQSYTVVVGAGAIATNTGGLNGGDNQHGADSWFMSNVTVRGGGGRGANQNTSGAGGTFTGDGGGAGGAGGTLPVASFTASGGGGAGGYTGTGGAGGAHGSAGGNGTGGSAGGGSGRTGPQETNSAWGGGGTGLLGQENNGLGAISSGGGGGSGGSSGGNPAYPNAGRGGNYGGGGGGGSNGGSEGQLMMGGSGGSGAVRIVWGFNYSYPNKWSSNTPVFTTTTTTSTSTTSTSTTTTSTTSTSTTTRAPTTTTTSTSTTSTSTTSTSTTTTSTSTTTTTTIGPLSVDYIIVGGGGSGGTGAGGGGGGGGVRAGTTSALPSTDYTVIVGGGGGGNGTASSAFSITANGGGAGGDWPANNNPFATAGSAGGCGGGGAGTYNRSGGYSGGGGNQGGSGGSGIAQLFLTNNLYAIAGGGGGGAGGGGGSASGSRSTGHSITFNTGGNGGSGYTWVNGVVYAGGGGGGVQRLETPPAVEGYNYTVGSGGSGGGGAGGHATRGATSGSGGLGGGGGGGGCRGDLTGAQYQVTQLQGGAGGGSGVVIIRYAGTPAASGGDISQSGGYTYHTFTTSGTFRRSV